ncbi:hypothetical protein K488DRAFT_75450, partial [Vararia minispora EC-137]
IPPSADLAQRQAANLQTQLGRARALLSPDVLLALRTARSAALSAALSRASPVPGDAQVMATLVDMDDVCGLPSADLPLFQALLDVVPAGLLPSCAQLLDALHVLVSDDPPPPPTYSAVEPAADSPLGQVLAQWRAAHAPVPSSPSPGPIDLDLWNVSDDVLAAPFPSTQPPPPSASAPTLVAEDAVMADAAPPAVTSGPIPPPSAPPVSALAAASVVGTPVPQPAPAPPPSPAVTSRTPGPAVASVV